MERASVLGKDRYRVAWRSRIPYELEFDFEVKRTDAPTAVLYDWNCTPQSAG